MNETEQYLQQTDTHNKTSTVEERQRTATNNVIYTPQDQGFHRFHRFPRGETKWGYQEFYKTPYEVNIPVRGNITSEVAHGEIKNLTSEKLTIEPFQDFYRHMHILTRFGKPEEVIPYISTIINRRRTEGTKFAEAIHPNNAEQQDSRKNDFYLLSMACLEKCEEDPSLHIPPNLVEQLYEEALTIHPRSLRYALLFDERNNHISNIQEQSKKYLSHCLLSSEKESRDKTAELLNWTYTNPHLLSEVLISCLSQAKKEQIIPITQQLAPAMGIEKMRELLREQVNTHPEFRPTFNEIFNYMEFDQGEETATQLGRDVYEKTDFSQYKPNEELLPFDTKLLMELSTNATDILDIGCGTGRHMENIADKTNAHIAGIDLVQEHIAKIKAKHPEFDVKEGSWNAIPFGDNHFDIAYCLGRSFTHNLTIPDAVNCLTEMKRVIKDDGCILLDLPDPTKGEYKNNIERTKQLASKKDFHNLLAGLINDSPDLKHYFDRWIPSEEAIYALAELSGLKAQKIITQKYQGLTENTENTNVYWKLIKEQSSKKINTSQREFLTNQIRSDHPIIFQHPPMPDQTLLSLSEQSENDG